MPTTESPAASLEESPHDAAPAQASAFEDLLGDGAAEAPEEPAAQRSVEETVPEPVVEVASAPAAENEAGEPRQTSGAAPRNGGPAVRRAPSKTPAARTFPRADRPAPVPSPEHHHLPGWVRRDFARARPQLADLLALLQGEERDQLQTRVDELTAGISSGKFSLAWQYPDVIEEGSRLYEQQRALTAEQQRANRALESARRRAGDRVRDAASTLPADAAARLQRALRTATDADAISDVAAEAERAIVQVKTTVSKRRDREIERTRTRLLRTLPRAAAEAEEPQSETWQDVLRRFAEQQQDAGESA